MITQTKITQGNLTPDLILNILREGNSRFIENKTINRTLLDQVEITSQGQFPFASILGCIDSRVPMELVFDLGIGDIFSTRVAGNIINGDVLGSMEYACKVAGSKLIVILGHTKCGAVTSACKGVELGNITALLSKIKPAVNQHIHSESDVNEVNIEKVVISNIEHSIKELRSKSPILKEMEDKGEIKIVGANYDVSTGKVVFL